MKKSMFFWIFVLCTILLASCEKKSSTGSLTLSITDSPIDTSGLSGVYISVSELQVHMSDSSWKSLEKFEPPKVFNLLELTRGESELLGIFDLAGGRYTQLRFMLDAPVLGENKPENPGCYIEFEDASTAALFVPSGSESGFKATGEFTVPVNGSVSMTTDFDLRKSITRTGSGNTGYILKPVIRLIVENQAGQINGIVSNIPEGSLIVIYSYEAGTYTDEESVLPADGSAMFPSAVNSDAADDNGFYQLSFLAAGSYDLIVTSINGNNETQVLDIIEGVSVQASKTTKQDIVLNPPK